MTGDRQMAVINRKTAIINRKTAVIEVWGVKGARRTPNGKGSCQTHEGGWQSPGSLSGTGTLFSPPTAAAPQQCCSYSMYKNCNVALVACIILFAYALYRA